MKKLLAAVIVSAATATPQFIVPASAHPPAGAFESCRELNRVYHHGVGRVGARDHVSTGSPRVTNWTRNTRVYHLNDGRVGTRPGVGQYDLDRDNDGIACERR
jgi:hypothetical protein